VSAPPAAEIDSKSAKTAASNVSECRVQYSEEASPLREGTEIFYPSFHELHRVSPRQQEEAFHQKEESWGVFAPGSLS
jgi:hypothetical protein